MLLEKNSRYIVVVCRAICNVSRRFLIDKKAGCYLVSSASCKIVIGNGLQAFYYITRNNPFSNCVFSF